MQMLRLSVCIRLLALLAFPLLAATTVGSATVTAALTVWLRLMYRSELAPAVTIATLRLSTGCAPAEKLPVAISA